VKFSPGAEEIPGPARQAERVRKGTSTKETIMFLFFLPPVVQAVIGIAVIAAGLVVHSYILAGVGVAGLVVGGARWATRSRRSGFQR
jgi:hypothetical protein